MLRAFPGGLVVRILGFHCCGPGSIPGRGTEILQSHVAKKNKTKRSVESFIWKWHEKLSPVS